MKKKLYWLAFVAVVIFSVMFVRNIHFAENPPSVESSPTIDVTSGYDLHVNSDNENVTSRLATTQPPQLTNHLGDRVTSSSNEREEDALYSEYFDSYSLDQLRSLAEQNDRKALFVLPERLFIDGSQDMSKRIEYFNEARKWAIKGVGNNIPYAWGYLASYEATVKKDKVKELAYIMIAADRGSDKYKEIEKKINSGKLNAVYGTDNIRQAATMKQEIEMNTLNEISQ